MGIFHMNHTESPPGGPGIDLTNSVLSDPEATSRWHRADSGSECRVKYEDGYNPGVTMRFNGGYGYVVGRGSCGFLCNFGPVNVHCFRQGHGFLCTFVHFLSNCSRK